MKSFSFVPKSTTNRPGEKFEWSRTGRRAPRSSRSESFSARDSDGLTLPPTPSPGAGRRRVLLLSHPGLSPGQDPGTEVRRRMTVRSGRGLEEKVTNSQAGTSHLHPSVPLKVE